MAYSYGPSIVKDGLLLALDAGNRRSYLSGSSTWNDLSGRGVNFTLFNPTYYSFDPASFSIGFTRTMPPTAENGGYGSITATGPLAASTYLYQNHTTELFAKINDRNPTNRDATEGLSALFVYRGNHAMFYYLSSSLLYEIWNGNSSTVAAPTMSISSSNADIIEGRWFHVCVVKNGNTLNSYINGVSKGTSSFATLVNFGVTTNELKIAQGNPIGQQYTWTPNCNISTIRMYNRALSSAEVLQNYTATKGRFGLA
jgi:hypothetical protein